MPKVILIETCGNCEFCDISGSCADDNSVTHKSFCNRISTPLQPIYVDPDSPPPDGCPLPDLGAVMEEVRQQCGSNGAYRSGWLDCIVAVRGVLAVAEKGGEK